MSPWPTVTLAELGANMRNACVGGPFGSNLTTKDYVDAPGVPVIRGANLGETGFIDAGFVYVSDEKAKALQYNQASSGDILFTQRGTIGQVALIPTPARFEHYLLSQSQMKLTPDLSRTEPRFIVHYFRSPPALAFLKRNTLATGVPHINLSILKRVPVPIPPLPEQRRIADILDKADAIRRKRKEAIALTEQLLRSAFLEMFGDPVTNPKGWPTAPLSEFGSVITGNTPSRSITDYFGDHIEWIKSDNINTPSHYLTRASEWLSTKGKKQGRTAPAGSTLMTCIAGSPDCIGNVALADREIAFNQQINAVVPHKGIDPRFLYTLLLLGKRLIQGASTNSMKGMVSKGRLEQVHLPAPTAQSQRTLQATFGAAFDKIIDMTRRQETAHAHGEYLFASLVAVAFSDPN